MNRNRKCDFWFERVGQYILLVNYSLTSFLESIQNGIRNGTRGKKGTHQVLEQGMRNDENLINRSLFENFNRMAEWKL